MIGAHVYIDIISYIQFIISKIDLLMKYFSLPF